MYVSMKVENYEAVFDSTGDNATLRQRTLPLSIGGVGVDSILYDSVSLSEFNVPLKVFDTISQFRIMRTDTVLPADTLSVYHDNSMEFLSLECGCITYHTLRRVETTTHIIDSIIILNGDVKTSIESSGTNLRIYFRTDD